MVGLTPTVHAKINGSDALFIADSGAFTNMLSPAAAAAFKLNLKSNPDIPYVIGMGGTAPAYVTEVKSFTIFDITFPRVLFVVAGNDMPAGAAGLIGQNVLRIADVEYDLANGMIRLMRPKDCKERALAYWAENTGKPFTVIDIESATARNPNTQGVAYLNGQKIRVMFDTGAAYSTLTRSAARRAGITPASAGVMNGGLWAGAGRGTVKTWIGPFASFKIGEEEIQNTRLRFADADLFADADMLIGVDFFLSHRIYVANSQRKLYFTYNGGPVFNLGAAPAGVAARLRLRRKAQLRRRTYHPPVRRCPTRASMSPRTLRATRAAAPLPRRAKTMRTRSPTSTVPASLPPARPATSTSAAWRMRTTANPISRRLTLTRRSNSSPMTQRRSWRARASVSAATWLRSCSPRIWTPRIARCRRTLTRASDWGSCT